MKSSKHHVYCFFMVCLLSLLASCGGGGSGGGGSPQSGSVTVDLAPINLKYIEYRDTSGFDPRPEGTTLIKIVSVDGIDLDNLPENFGLGFVEENSSNAPRFNISYTPRDNKHFHALFVPDSTLPPGAYTGTFQLIACYANASFDDCGVHLTGSPSEKVPYQITIFPRLQLPEPYTGVVVNQGKTTPVVGETIVHGSISKDDLAAKMTYSPTASQWLTITRTVAGYAYSINAKNAPIGNHAATVSMTSLTSKQVITQTFELMVQANSYRGVTDNVTLHIDITDQTTVADLQTEILVALEDDKVYFPWRATANVSWIIFDKNTGQSGERVVFRVSTPHIASMPTETEHARAGSTAIITIHNESTLTLAPLNATVNVHRLTSELQSLLSAPSPVNTSGFPVLFIGKNLGRATLEATGPSTLTFPIFNPAAPATYPVAPAIPGVYTVRTINALGIPTSPITVTFLANAQHTYSFIATNGYKRSMAYDQTRDALYVADKTNHQLVRLAHSNGVWANSQIAVPDISDLGLSEDRKRLFVSKTTGALTRINASNFTVERNYSYGKPFPEYRTLSQNLQVRGLGLDFIPILTEFTPAPGADFLSGIVSFSSAEDAFLPVSGIGYNPERGGWFARGRQSGLAYFSQMNPTQGSDSGTGLIGQTTLKATSSDLAYSKLARFETLDVGLTEGSNFFGLVDRKRYTSAEGYSAELPSIPADYRTVGSVVSPDWRYIYLLAYPNAALNGDLPTTLTPRVYVYESTNPNAPVISMLPTYFEFNHFPTCRRAADASCVLDTLSSVSMDGRTLFFAGDQGIAVVPVPPTFRVSQSIMSKSGFSNRHTKPASLDKVVGSKNFIRIMPQSK